MKWQHVALHPLTLAFGGATMLGIGFVLPFLWPLALIGLFPLIHLALDTARSIRHIFFLGLLDFVFTKALEMFIVV